MNYDYPASQWQSPQASTVGLHLAGEATVCMYKNLLINAFISVGPLIKCADVLSVEELCQSF